VVGRHVHGHRPVVAHPRFSNFISEVKRTSECRVSRNLEWLYSIISFH
jgi:phenylalanine-4-hydroxylase